MPTPFEKFFDKLDELNIISSEGPDATDAAFLTLLVNTVADLQEATRALTVSDVETEFTDEGEDDEDEQNETEANAESVFQ